LTPSSASSACAKPWGFLDGSCGSSIMLKIFPRRSTKRWQQMKSYHKRCSGETPPPGLLPKTRTECSTPFDVIRVDWLCGINEVLLQRTCYLVVRHESLLRVSNEWLQGEGELH
jgi:hypothetical protein